MAERLIVRGAREHNLRDVHLDLPRDALIVFTGLSGSGKSSLAFDTIFAEGSGVMSRACRLTRASSSVRWTSPMSTSSRACRRRFPSIRSPPLAIRVRPSARSPRSTTTCACSMRGPAGRTARSAGARSPARPRSRSSTGCSSSMRARVPGAGTGGSRAQGRVRRALPRPADQGFCPGPGRRPDLPAGRRADQAGQAEEAHHRGRGRPAHRPDEREAAADRFGRDGAPAG